jgi:uncharacterized protein
MPNRRVLNRFGIPFQGFGVGLREPHLDAIRNDRPRDFDWFEIITENYLDPQRWPILDDLSADYPFYLHGVGLSIGSTDPLDESYLKAWVALIRHLNPVVVSDHLCWTGVSEVTVHDLLPMVYNRDTLGLVSDRVKRVQDRIGRVLALENPSTYLTWQESVMPEAEFLAELAVQADCAILLDVNNVVVSAVNHGFDVAQYLNTLPSDRVVQIHLAGHQDCGTHRIDTHDAPIIADVFAAYRQAIQRFEAVSTMIERDAKIPPLSELAAELTLVKQHFDQAFSSAVVAAPP